MQVFLTPEAKKQHLRLSKVEQRKVEKRLVLLEDKPLSGKKLLGKYANLRSLRAWPYRIIYYINSRQEVWVVSILHRQGVYR